MDHNTVNIGNVYRNSGAWKALESKIKELSPSRVFVLTDSNTRIYCLPLYLEKSTGIAIPSILEMPAGESYKTIDTCVMLWNELAAANADRNSLLINLGGGVVTDLGGFVASTFKRGIPFINIPTSLLAMVDASVGGKNGVDLGAIKNQIGVIRQPEMVVVDIDFLNTLPEPHMISGRAEMYKHGLIHSREYWKAVDDFDLSDKESTNQLIWESIAIKNDVVTTDPFEKGLRKSLNYGHTLGHAIESYCLENESKTTLLHGEAIAIGMILATFISNRLLGFPEEALGEISRLLVERYPKAQFSQEDVRAIIELLIYDKKNANGEVRFVLLSDFGKHKTDCLVEDDLILEAFKFYNNLF